VLASLHTAVSGFPMIKDRTWLDIIRILPDKASAYSTIGCLWLIKIHQVHTCAGSDLSVS
jgi:hypothetical protein